MYNITIVVAMDKNSVIGKGGEVPWKLRRDMKHFTDTTTGKIVVMGRKTYDSLPKKFKPLPDRKNMILTRDEDFIAPTGCTILRYVEEILELSREEEIFVIGGAQVYRQLLPYANKLIVTDIDTEIEGGDTFFPNIGPEWRGRLLWRHEVDSKNPFAFWVLEYTRK